jgi:hypothetical protein
MVTIPSLAGVAARSISRMASEHTCIEATVRYAAELGYEVTVARRESNDPRKDSRSRVHGEGSDRQTGW